MLRTRFYTLVGEQQVVPGSGVGSLTGVRASTRHVPGPPAVHDTHVHDVVRLILVVQVVVVVVVVLVLVILLVVVWRRRIVDESAGSWFLGVELPATWGLTLLPHRYNGSMLLMLLLLLLEREHGLVEGGEERRAVLLRFPTQVRHAGGTTVQLRWRRRRWWWWWWGGRGGRQNHVRQGRRCEEREGRGEGEEGGVVHRDQRDRGLRREWERKRRRRRESRVERAGAAARRGLLLLGMVSMVARCCGRDGGSTAVWNCGLKYNHITVGVYHSPTVEELQ